MTTGRPRLLVLRGGAIGDFVLTLPALAALRERWPSAHIEVMGYPRMAKLAMASGLVNRVESFERADMARLFVPDAKLSDMLSAYFTSFDVIVSYLYDPDELVRVNLLAAGVRQVICGSPVVGGVHAADHLVQPLQELAIYAEGAAPTLRLPPDLTTQGAMWLQQNAGPKPIAIHPGSGSDDKNWALPHFLELCMQVERADLGSPLLLLGEADRAITEQLDRDGVRYPRVQGVDLDELAAILAGCRAYVGNDSGITHLAAALGLPVVALFGPTNARIWRPRGEHVRVLEAPEGDLRALTVQAVFAALDR